MSKLKLTESQVTMVQQRELDLEKMKVLKINEGQYARIFRNEGMFKGGFNKASKTMSKTLKNNGIKENEDKKEITPLEFAQELIVFIKDLITNPRDVPFSTYWKELGISRKELVKLVKEQGLLTLMVDEGGTKSYNTKKRGFRENVKKVLKEILKRNESMNEADGGYPAGAEFDPNATWNLPEPDDDEGRGEVVENPTFEDIYFNEKSDDLIIFKHSNDLYGFISATVDEVEFKPFMDMDSVDRKAIDNYINAKAEDKELKISLEFPEQNTEQVQGKDGNPVTIVTITKITPENKGQLIEWYGHDGEMVEMLNQLPESTTGAGALGSGGPIGPMSDRGMGTNMRSPDKEIGRVTSGKSPEETHIINEDMAINKFLVTYNLEDNGGDTSPFLDEFHQVQEFVNALERKGIVSGVKVSKTGSKGEVIKEFTYDFNGQEWEKRNEIEESTSTTSVGGDSGTFAFDAPAGDGNAFWNAGNKLNKGNGGPMPIVKRAIVGESFHEPDGTPIGVDSNHMPIRKYKKGQMLKNGDGRATILDVKPEGLDVKIRDGAGTRFVPNLDPDKLAGWNFVLEGKKVLKLTKKQIKMISEADNMKSTGWPNGSFVEFDDCVKYNNNTEAQEGGCSQGAVDNVVKLSKTKDSVVSEGLKLLHDKNNQTLAVVSDSKDPKTASKETYTSKNILKQNGFDWNGSNWIISVDQLDIAKKTLTKVNKVEYFVDKLDELGELLQGSADATGGKGLVNAQLDQYITDIANATDEAAASSEIRRYLNFHTNFHQYSFNNKILIYIQRPEATRVSSFNAWKKKGRKVQKGSKGIKILVPIFRKGENPGVGAKKPEIDLTDLDSLSQGSMGPQPIGFKVGNVFDIADTKAFNAEGEVPDSVQWAGSDEPSEIADKLFDSLSIVADNLGIKVTATDSRRGEKGFSAGDHINLTSDVKGAGRVATMAHEMAHELMHWKKKSMYYIGDENVKNKALLELQAETVSYVVLKHYTIPVQHHAKYLALWGANKDKILKYLKLISDVSDFIIKEIDKVAKYETDDTKVSESIGAILKEIGF